MFTNALERSTVSAVWFIFCLILSLQSNNLSSLKSGGGNKFVQAVEMKGKMKTALGNNVNNATAQIKEPMWI